MPNTRVDWFRKVNHWERCFDYSDNTFRYIYMTRILYDININTVNALNETCISDTHVLFDKRNDFAFPPLTHWKKKGEKIEFTVLKMENRRTLRRKRKWKRKSAAKSKRSESWPTRKICATKKPPRRTSRVTYGIIRIPPSLSSFELRNLTRALDISERVRFARETDDNLTFRKSMCLPKKKKPPREFARVRSPVGPRRTRRSTHVVGVACLARTKGPPFGPALPPAGNFLLPTRHANTEVGLFRRTLATKQV